ncbi:hypothetical protein NIES4103_16870 [Nostoc sp. NIES-4103]|nr:hypothetical protein NIES4103_16870 [Nostoc sp. NIES-4103]
MTELIDWQVNEVWLRIKQEKSSFLTRHDMNYAIASLNKDSDRPFDSTTGVRKVNDEALRWSDRPFDWTIHVQ